MASMTIRGLPDEVHKQIKVRATANWRSAEAEVRHILISTIKPTGTGLGSSIRNLWGDALGDDLTIERSQDGPRKVSFK